jgi:sec-independent protein translocase protein TatA
MFGISGEHLLILGIVLLIFGPRRLPELGNTLGKAIRNFKDSLSGVEEAKFRRIEEEKNAQQQAAANRAAQSASPASPEPITGEALKTGSGGNDPHQPS